MMIDWDKPLQTRDGHEAVLYTTGGKDPKRPLVGEHKRITGYWETACWSREGRFLSSGEESCLDLINAPEKKYYVAYKLARHQEWVSFSTEKSRSGWIAMTEATILHTWEQDDE